MSENDLKVLIVDDDKFLLDIYRKKFKEEGVGVEVALGSEEALIKIRSGKNYDILVLDTVMPLMDGYALLNKIKEEKLMPSATIVILSNDCNPLNLDKARKYGVQGFIAKASTTPFEIVKEVLEIAKNKVTR